MKRVKLFSVILAMLVAFAACIAFAGCGEEAETENEYPKKYSCEDDPHVQEKDGKVYYVQDDGEYARCKYALYNNAAYYFTYRDGSGTKLSIRYTTANIISIAGSGGVIYIVQGDDSALVIDTSFGFGDTSELVELILGDKPYEVALTHTHPDHVGGVFSFEGKTKVWTTYEDARDVYGRWDLEVRAADVVKAEMLFEVEDLVPVSETFEFSIFDDGYEFHLGNYDIEVIKTPGHSLGSVAFLFKQDRLLLTGDNANPTVLLSGGETNTTVEGWMNNLIELNKRSDEWDYILSSHMNGMYHNKNLLENLINIGTYVMGLYTENASPEDAQVMSSPTINSCTIKYTTDMVFD